MKKTAFFGILSVPVVESRLHDGAKIQADRRWIFRKNIARRSQEAAQASSLGDEQWGRFIRIDYTPDRLKKFVSKPSAISK